MKSLKRILSILLTLFIMLSINGYSKNMPKNTSSQTKNILKSSELKKVTINSKYLKKAMNLNIYLPKGYSRKIKYPVLYMIHGYGQNGEDTWMPDLKLNKKADELIESGKINPLIIVTPQMDNSWGINSAEFPSVVGKSPNTINRGMYEYYLCKEVIPFIDSNYSTNDTREGRYIGGLSMGGFIALHTAFLHTDMFSKVGGHSPGLIQDDTPVASGYTNFLYPNKYVRRDTDPVLIAQDKDLSMLKVYLDCGDKDMYKFYVGSEILYKTLKKKKVPVEYHLNKGQHDAAYWMKNEENYLMFYSGKKI